MTDENTIFERDMEVAEIKHTQVKRDNKQTNEVEIMLRGADCILAVRQFRKTSTQLVDGEIVKVVITGRK